MTQESLIFEFRRMRNKKALLSLIFAGAVLYMYPWHGYILWTLVCGFAAGWLAKDAFSVQNSLSMVQNMEWPTPQPPESAD